MTTTMNINTMPAPFTFRSKFEKIVTDENRSIITAAFQKFCSFTSDSARDFLWRLSYDTDDASIALSELDLTPEIISYEKISCLRNELRYQYEKLVRPNFLDVEIHEECQEAYTALVNHTDVIVANIVFEHCKSRQYTDVEYMSRLLFLLKSDKENNHFGGIRSLHFSLEAAAYLKQFHIQIHDLMKAMYDHYQAQCGPSPKNCPFEGLDALVEDAGMDLPFEFKDPSEKKVSSVIQEEQPVQVSSGFKPLTSDEVLAHKDVFASFLEGNDMNMLLGIAQFGFDLNMVMAKKRAIANLLEAIKMKEKADAYLVEATEFMNQ